MMNLDPLRWASAAAMVAAYALMCFLLARARAGRAAATSPDGGAADWLIAFASQTGTGEQLAQQTLATLRTGGLSARALSIEHLTLADLAGGSRILFIVSTYGEGDAPDSAEGFARRLAGASALEQLHYGVLALGDSSYTHFCGFGRALDASLKARGAQALFPRIDVDRGGSAAIEQWRHHLSHLAGTADAPDWSAPAWQEWRLLTRELLNPGSAGAPVYRIALAPASGSPAAWEAGDLVQISAPADPDYPREYSIASLPPDGRVDLLVRLHLRDDGSAGAASGWLCRDAQAGATVALRLRQHARFRIGANAERPLILIGNGTGLAGLLSHLAQRAARGQGPNWLLFGERQARHDDFCRAQLAHWLADGVLESLDTVFSRDGDALRYVQHALAMRGEQLRAWVGRGAAIYVCGSLHGMAGDVHAVLEEQLGAATLARLADEGRYRRDVY